MGSYKISLKRSVNKDLRKIEKSEISKIVSAVESLGEMPFPANSRKLVGSRMTYRLRAGDYWVIYMVDE